MTEVMFPVFFSVSSINIAFAEEIWAQLPDDWVYVYSKTGEEGAHMWDEISHRELPQSQVIVIFWSKDYVTAKGCVKEILQAQSLVQQRQLRPIVLRLDDFPISWRDEFGEDAKPVFDALRSMLDYRTSSANVTSLQAIDLVKRVVEPILMSDHPRLPRHELQQTLQAVVKKDRYSYYPSVWISGFNGVGRETLVRDFNRSFAPNGRGIVIDVSEASLPKQTLLRIESEAFGATRERLQQLNAAMLDDEAKAVAECVERVFAGGNFLILRHNRIVEENVELPDWLDDVINALTPATRPKLYIISQLPLLAERRTRCRNVLVAQRVPTVDETQITEFCYQIVAYFDRNPARWTDVEVDGIVRASGGNVGFLVSLVRAAAGIEDFDQIDQLIAADNGSITVSITAYVRWAFSQLRDFDDEQRALLFLNDISPCDITDLEKAITPSRPILRVLGKLLDLGLIEREGDSLYRLTPLLARRLSRDLIRSDLLLWLRRALVEFVKKPFEIEEDGHDYLRIESRIQASLLSEMEELPQKVVEFVSAAHWLHAGIRLYYARRREPAYKMLKRAYQKRAEFVAASRIELARYFCLSATRNRKYKEAEEVIRGLEGVFQTKSMAAFLRADLLEHQRRFVEAIEEYKRSIELNRGKDSRLERTYRPLVRCILLSPRPDFSRAEAYAKEWLKLRETVFSLMALARVYLNWRHRGEANERDVPANISTLYKEALADLESHPGGIGSASFELKAEEAEFTGDFDGALEYMDKAIGADPRFELRGERWRLMAKSGSQPLAGRVIVELDAARTNPEYQANWLPFLPTLAETYAIALKAAGRPLGSLNHFAPQLLGDEIGAIVSRVNRSR